MAPQSPRVPSDFELMRNRQAGAQAGYAASRDAYMQSLNAAIERRAREKEEEDRLRQQRLLAAQNERLQVSRDKTQQQYTSALTAQRANIAADQAAADARYRQQLAQQERQDQQRQAALQAQNDRRQALLQNQFQTDSDKRRFDFATAETEQSFQNQVYRDMLQQQNLLERDAGQFGIDALLAQQSQQGTLQRDMAQAAIQAERDMRLGDLDIRQQQMQFEDQQTRDQAAYRRDIAQQRMQQQFQQQSRFEQEASDIAARWQAQVQQAKTAGLDFSPAQQKKMQEMDAAFRENVVNADLDEGVKARALVEHNRQLSTIVPEQKVVTPEQEIANQFYFHPQMQRLLKRTIGPNGMPEWDFADTGMSLSGSSQVGQAQAAAQKQVAAQQKKAQLDAKKNRLAEFEQTINSLSQQVDATGIMPKYPDTPEGRQRLLGDAILRFAPREQFYINSMGIEPLPVDQYFQYFGGRPPAQQPQPSASGLYSGQAQRMQQSRQQLPPAQSQIVAPPQSDRPQPSASTVNAPDQSLAGQIAYATQKNDADAVTALQRVFALAQGGVPANGSPEMDELVTLMRYLRDRGYNVAPQKRTATPKPPRQQSESDLPMGGFRTDKMW